MAAQKLVYERVDGDRNGECNLILMLHAVFVDCNTRPDKNDGTHMYRMMHATRAHERATSTSDEQERGGAVTSNCDEQQQGMRGEYALLAKRHCQCIVPSHAPSSPHFDCRPFFFPNSSAA